MNIENVLREHGIGGGKKIKPIYSQAKEIVSKTSSIPNSNNVSSFAVIRGVVYFARFEASNLVIDTFDLLTDLRKNTYTYSGAIPIQYPRVLGIIEDYLFVSGSSKSLLKFNLNLDLIEEVTFPDLNDVYSILSHNERLYIFNATSESKSFFHDVDIHNISSPTKITSTDEKINLRVFTTPEPNIVISTNSDRRTVVTSDIVNNVLVEKSRFLLPGSTTAESILSGGKGFVGIIHKNSTILYMTIYNYLTGVTETGKIVNSPLSIVSTNFSEKTDFRMHNASNCFLLTQRGVAGQILTPLIKIEVSSGFRVNHGEVSEILLNSTYDLLSSHLKLFELS